MSERVPAELRALVRNRAAWRCEYCLLHEEDAFLPHEPDHIVSCKHRGETNDVNLAWSCFLCNRLKGSDIASIDIETGQIVRLFNPRTDRWSDHFCVENGLIVALTPIGRVTEYLLRFNLPDAVEDRRRLMSAGRYPR